MSIQIVTDSTAAFSRREMEGMNLEIVPLSIHFNGEVFDEGFPDSYSEYYRLLSDSKALPTTSQPSVGRFFEVFKKALDRGHHVVAVLFSSALSGTVSSAQMAAELAGSDRVTVIDTMNAVSNLKQLVVLAWQAAQAGATAGEIAEKVNVQSPTMNAILTVDDLIYLKRGGRLNNSQYFVGKLLNIHPLIMLREGKLYPQARIAGQKAVMSAFQQFAPESTTGITVCHAENPEGAERLRALMAERFPNLNIAIDVISPVIGSHLGPGALGYCYTCTKC